MKQTYIDGTAPQPAPAPLSVEQLRELLIHACGEPAQFNMIKCSEMDIPDIHAALLPYLREPVGWELNTPENGWLSDGFCIFNPATSESHSLDSFVSYVASRIRPVYECQECAKWKAERNVMYRDWDDCRKRMLKVHLALNDGDES